MSRESSNSESSQTLPRKRSGHFQLGADRRIVVARRRVPLSASSEEPVLASVNEVREDIWQMLEHIRQSLRLLLLVSLRVLRIVLAHPFRLCLLCVSLAIHGLLIAFKLFLSLIVVSYFAFRYFRPGSFKDPLLSSEKIKRAKIWDAILRTDRVLMVGLTKTLLFCTDRKPPRKSGFVRVAVPNAPGGALYVKPRPHLTEFLQMMALHFKVVVFSHYGQFVADELVKAVDKNNLVYDIFCRRDMVRVGGRMRKSAAVLHQSSEKVLIVDVMPDMIVEKECLLQLKPFTGSSSDDELLAVARFITARVKNDVKLAAIAASWTLENLPGEPGGRLLEASVQAGEELGDG